MATETERQRITPPTLARRWGISPSKIINWIQTGELGAIDVSEGSTRPRYLISEADIKLFEERRAVGTPPIKRVRRQGRRDIKEFV